MRSGTGRQRDELVDGFRRKRRLGLMITALVAVFAGAGLYAYLRWQIPDDPDYAEELNRIQKCDMTPEKRHLDDGTVMLYEPYLTEECRRMIGRVIRRLKGDLTRCQAILTRIRNGKDWQTQNRLVQLLLRYRRSRWRSDDPVSESELAPDPCVEDGLAHVVRQWAVKKANHRTFPGLADYNVVMLSSDRHVAVKTRLLPLLPKLAQRRLAAHLLTQFRALHGMATGPAKEALTTLFKNVFYPRWAALGKPEAKPKPKVK